MSRLALRILAAALTPIALSSADADPSPSIVFVLADDLGYGDVGFNGCTDIATPNIDRIASEGVRLPCFYVASQCSPTRAGLLTGRYPTRYGMQDGVVWPWSDWGLPPEEETIAETLRGAGYATMIAGKWHLGQARRELLPLAQGFDHHYGMYSGYIDHVTHRVRDDGRAFDWFRDGMPSHDEGHATELVAREAAKFVQDAPRGRPFFLYVAFPAPHAPLAAPQRYVDMHVALEEPRRTYAAMVSCMDDGVGVILDALDATGRAESTLVVFASDNGGELTNDGTAMGYGATSAGLRSGKGTPFEGGVRAAAAARWPAAIPPGSTVHDPVHIVDWNPTLREMADLPAQQDERPLDGVSLLALLKGEASSLPPRTLLLQNNGRGIAVLRSDGWKLVERNGASMLFDIARDPGEQHDVAAENSGIVGELHAESGRLRMPSVPPLSARDGNRSNFVWPDRVDTPPRFSWRVALGNRPNAAKALAVAVASGVVAAAVLAFRLRRKMRAG